LTTVVSLHQVDFARQFADRIIGLKQGAVVFDGAPLELSTHQVTDLYRHHTSVEARPVSAASSATVFQQSSLLEV
jgi:ABC-type phosphate/phosphonate transport system ATPase subunit